MNETVMKIAQSGGVLVRAGSVICHSGRWYDVLEDTVFFDPMTPAAPQLAMMGKIQLRRDAA